MPKEFAINWFKNTTKDFSDPEEALMEFQVMLNKLHLSYSVNNIDLEHENEPEKKEGIRSEIPETIPNVKQSRNTKAIPSTNNFPEFKKWLLNKLSELEKIV